MTGPDRTILAAMTRAAEGRVEEAVALLRRAAAGRGQTLPHLLLLAEYCGMLGQPEQGLYFAQQAAARAPGRGEPHAARGVVLLSCGRLEEAEAAFAEAARLSPGLSMAHGNLGLSRQARGEYAGAERSLRAALELDPSPLTFGNFSLLLTETGRVEEVIGLLRGALERWPGSEQVLFHLCFALNYSDRADPGGVLDLHRQYGRSLRPEEPRCWANARDPERALRVGFVSGDLRGHSVARFLGPVLEQLDPGHFETMCYATRLGGDATTQRLQRASARWRDVARMPEAALAKQVREDGIDVLIDLAGLTGGHRLGVFARRAAPVQATWIGYANTTGVPAMDARLVDATTDPPGAEARSSERLVRLPGCFLCYRPDAEAPQPRPRDDGPVTFGSFNALPKVSDAAVGMWSRVLGAAPGSRLLLKAKALSDAPTRERVLARFSAVGVDPGRVELLGQAASIADHLALYHRVDVALDTWPYAGTTTTCEALWMGVPVVTLAGTVHAARVGASLLTAAGLADWIAGSPEAYVEIASALAKAPARLAECRATLRDRLRASPLLDAPAYTPHVERALRGLWREWCAASR